MTAKELEGHCERFQPGKSGISNRSRIIIARSQEPNSRHQSRERNVSMNVNNYLNNSFLNDSIMSTLPLDQIKSQLRPPGTAGPLSNNQTVAVNENLFTGTLNVSPPKPPDAMIRIKL